MSDIQNIYTNAELSLAAYASLENNSQTSNTSNIEALIDAGFSAEQAKEFAKQYPVVVEQYNDTDTSFSATVFKDSDGNLTLAIRGTLEAGDFVPTDANIALYGAGYDQIIAMYNWWRRVSTPSGQEVEQYEVHSYINGVDTVPDGAVLLYIEPHSQNDMAYYMIESDKATSNGELVDDIASDDDHKLDVTGHSLGGHLAMAFGSLFSGVTDEVTVFNAPGFKTTSNTAFFAKLGGSIPTGVDTTNVIADEAGVGEVPWSAIAGLHNRPGTAVDIAIEDQWNSDEPNHTSAYNHSQQTLTDALAVYATLSKLDPSLDAETFKWVLTNAANGTAASLEHVVDALDELFTKDTNELVVGNNNREDLYVRLYAIQDSATFINAVGKLRVVQTSSLASSSQQNTDQGLAYRYALVHLNPFAISGDAAIYSQHNGSGELDWYNPADGTGSITDAYIKARSAMLEWKMLYDNDIFGYLNKESAVYGNWDYLDLTSGVTLAIDGKGTSIYDHQIVFGSSAGEPLEGSGDSDQLFGIDGNDTLQGKGGNDYLEGGTGDDTYIYNTGDGFDTILDTHGDGKIMFDGEELTGGKEVGIDVYQSEDKKYTYKLIRHADARQDLMINNNIMIKDFEPGDLSINLGGADPYAPPDTSLAITGDHTPIEFDDGWHYDDLGNIVVDPGSNEVRDDNLFGSSGNDKIQGFNGQDRIDGDAGDDILEGGEDIDLIIGGVGNDEIHAGDWIDISALASYAGFVSSQHVDEKGDWIAGGLGEDTVIGSAGHDVLFGGGGEDLILGGSGNDIIDGDDNYMTDYFEWSAAAQESNPFQMVWYNAYAVDDWAGDVGAADIIYGGVGDDYINGVLGEDLLFGEEGADILVGDGDADTIYGGDGDDKIAGDRGRSAWGIEPNQGKLVDPGDDFLYGGAGNDLLMGEEGDDYLFGGSGDDELQGDAVHVEEEAQGDDYLAGGDGDDILFGQGGEDMLLGDAGEDELQGGDGSDWLEGGMDSDSLYGDAGNDFIFGDDGHDYIEGGDDNDYLSGGIGDDGLFGGEGDDILVSGAGNDYLEGGAGADTFIFHSGDGVDTIGDGDAEDTVSIQSTNEISASIYGNNAYLKLRYGISDVLYIKGGTATQISRFDLGSGQILTKAELFNSTLNTDVNIQLQDAGEASGGAGDDIIIGSDGSDLLYGLNGNDTIDGGDGNDIIYSGAGNDYVYGGAGNDTIYGEGGNDTLEGGAGNDSYCIHYDYIQYSVTIRDTEGSNSLVLGFSASHYSPVLSYGSLKLSFDNSQIEVHLDSFDPNDVLGGPRDIDTFVFSDVTYTYEELVALGFDLNGTAGNDAINGTSVVDRITGLEGDDVLRGGAGNDRYIFRAGDGVDIIRDDVGRNTIQLLGIGLDEITTTSMTDSDGATYLVVNYSSSDAVHIENGLEHADRFELSDGVYSTEELVSITFGDSNHAPVIDMPLPDQTTAEDELFTFQIPEGTFTDQDAGDVLSLSAELADGSALPDWLSFDPATNTLSGTPDNSQVGSLDIRITATDSAGESIFDTFTLDVTNVNDAPELINALTDAEAVEGDSFSYTIPADAFRDIDADDILTYTATLANGGSLPGWLSLDSNSMTLVGELPMDAAGEYDITIQATDQSGAGASDTFHLSVTNLVQNPTWWHWLRGTSFNDLIIGSDSSEWLHGYAGNDRLIAYGGNDLLDGGAGNDILDGGAGRDALFGGDGDDVLIGDDGNDRPHSSWGWCGHLGWHGFGVFDRGNNDTLWGGNGNDQLQGGAGDDYLNGGSGSDTYRFSLHDGQDAIDNYDAGSDNLDTLLFDGISGEDLLFSRQWHNLVIDVVGTDDRVTVNNWFRGESFQLDAIETDDLVLQNDQVNQLVNAMAVFGVPTGVGSIIHEQTRDHLGAVLVSSSC